MKSKFQFNVNFSPEQDEFDVNVVNLSERKGYVDIAALKGKLKEILLFLQISGIDDLVELSSEEPRHD